MSYRHLRFVTWAFKPGHVFRITKHDIMVTNVVTKEELTLPEGMLLLTLGGGVLLCVSTGQTLSVDELDGRILELSSEELASPG